MLFKFNSLKNVGFGAGTHFRDHDWVESIDPKGLDR